VYKITVKIEFDPDKDAVNVIKHGISLQAEGAHENVIRAISLRLAEKHEARFYYGQI
jgi:uncharacterized DUF497 family protein